MGKKIFTILIALWALISLAAISYNMLKIIPEVKEWGFISDTEKRYKIFGDLYLFINFIDKNTNSGEILIVSNDVRTFYLSAYYLYPKRIEVISESQIKNFKSFEKYKYVALFNLDKKIDNFSLIKAEKSKNSKFFWEIYKNE